MIGYQQRAEQQIREHQSRQLRFDEIAAGERMARNPCEGGLGRSRDAWRRISVARAGPMGIWDVVAQDLEGFVELFEQAPRCGLPRKLGHSGTLHSL